MKNLKLNYIYNVLYQVLLLLTPLITTPYTSRVLGADGIGEYSFTASIVSYFTMFAILGSNIYAQREIAYYQTDKKRRSRIFGEMVIFRGITSLIAIAFYCIILVNVQFRTIYLIQILTIISVATDIAWFFQGLEEFGKTVFRNAIFKILNIVVIFLFVKAKKDLNIYVFGICFLQFLSTLSLWVYVPKYVQKIKMTELKIAKHLKPILLLFIPTIAIQVYTVLDKTMIGIFSIDSIENGYYEQALKLSRMVLTIVTSLGTVMVPRIGKLFFSGETEMIKNYMYRSYNFVWFLSIPLAFGLIGISSNIVPWFYGAGYDKVIELQSILALLIIAVGISNVTGIQYMVPTKKERMFNLCVICGSVLNFVLNLLLIPRMLSIGAAIASVSAEFLISALQLFLVRKELSWKNILLLSRKYILAGVTMLVTIKLVSMNMVASMTNTCILILIGGFVYLAVLVILRDTFLCNDVKKSVVGLLHKVVRRN